ncbi:MAG: hypothetical protein ICV62_02250 [Cyanobacteria bacterium Co-bin13]|nr:hypothetical protein [Cyanobacteria bacterium Co-bin13]
MPVDKTEFLRLYQQGKQDVEIARLLNCSREYIRKVRNSYGLPVQPKAKKLDRLSAADRQAIEQKLLALLPIEQVAAEYGVSPDILQEGFREVTRQALIKRKEARLANISNHWQGQQVGMLTVQSVTQDQDTSEYWVECRCSCGRHKKITLNNLRSGRVFSCSKGGCMGLAKANALVYRQSLKDILAGEPRDPVTGRVSAVPSSVVQEVK